MIVSWAIRLELASLLNAVCLAAVNSLMSETLVIGEVERCVMQIVVAPFALRPLESVGDVAARTRMRNSECDVFGREQ